MSLRMLRTALPLALLLALCACASNQPYRPELATVCLAQQDKDCPTNTLQQHGPGQADEYYLGFVEYDDQGQLRDRQQMQAVLDKYYALAAQQGVIIVAFAHGWHHNAHPEDPNVESFRQLLGKVAHIESTGRKRKVLGVYLGWRGESITVPGINDLTFWERKNTAHSVGLQGVSELLVKLEEIVNVKAGTKTDEEPESRLIVMGHSFGGAVVYTALQQILADRFINSRTGKTSSEDAGGFGSLVVLLNPAFEAIRYSALHNISQDFCRRYSPSQQPRLAILTSEADWATGLAFPAGRWFSTFFETHGTISRHSCTAEGQKQLLIDEGEASRQTVGHFAPYISHKLLPAPTRPNRDDAADFRRLKEEWVAQTPAGRLDFDGSQLIHLGVTRPLDPYLNIRVDKALIPNHNDIWGEEVMRFVRDLILMSTTPLQPVANDTATGH